MQNEVLAWKMKCWTKLKEEFLLVLTHQSIIIADQCFVFVNRLIIFYKIQWLRVDSLPEVICGCKMGH